ncbi:oxidoreductase [Actinoplanes sp. NBRC 14428]|nr:oxidoreductase [Actinoplanes sp. NBRC 14428]
MVEHGDNGPVRFADVDEPEQAAGELLADIRHIGLNYGELRHAGQYPAGDIHGFDASGVVLRAAPDGSGPPEGTGVALAGAPYAWAERVAVRPAFTSVVPDGVDLADAAILGIAGVTALRVLRKRSLLARRVLITGASGGVGRFAVQLAAAAGARVTALAGSPERAAGLRELGATRVLTDLAEAEDRFDLVLDTVGGEQLVQAWGVLADGGDLHMVGQASGGESTFPPGSLFAFGESRRLHTYGDMDWHLFSAEMTDLLGLLAAGRLTAPIGRRGDWKDVGEAVRALFAREVTGKIVLDVS